MKRSLLAVFIVLIAALVSVVPASAGAGIHDVVMAPAQIRFLYGFNPLACDYLFALNPGSAPNLHLDTFISFREGWAIYELVADEMTADEYRALWYAVRPYMSIGGMNVVPRGLLFVDAVVVNHNPDGVYKASGKTSQSGITQIRNAKGDVIWKPGDTRAPRAATPAEYWSFGWANLRGSDVLSEWFGPYACSEDQMTSPLAGFYKMMSPSYEETSDR